MLGSGERIVIYTIMFFFKTYHPPGTAFPMWRGLRYHLHVIKLWLAAKWRGSTVGLGPTCALAGFL